MHGREPKSLNCGLEWMLEMMWGACLTGRYNCTLPRPPLHSQAVAGLRSRGRKNAWPSTGVLVVGLPGSSLDRCKREKATHWEYPQGRREIERDIWKSRCGDQTNWGSKIPTAWTDGQQVKRRIWRNKAFRWMAFRFHVSGSVAIVCLHSLWWPKSKRLNMKFSSQEQQKYAEVTGWRKCMKIHDLPVASESLKPWQCFYRFCCLWWAWCLRWCLVTLGYNIAPNQECGKCNKALVMLPRI